jgi:predicted nucleic acid-binding protein
MKYVLDASVAIRAVLPHPRNPKAIKLRDEYRQQIHELIAPSHFPDEIASALTKAERQRLIAVGDAHTFIQDALNTPPVLHATAALMDRAVEISSQTQAAYYDCLYVALAEREQCELVTADSRLVTKLQAQFPFLVELSSLP